MSLVRSISHVLQQAAPDEVLPPPPPAPPPPAPPPAPPPPNPDPPPASPSPPPDPAASWPQDWRARMAGGDAAYAKQLERYATPELAAKALQAAQARISEGFKPEPFPDKGTPEQQANWRKTAGVPATAEDYFKNVGDGIVIGETDKAIFEDFAKNGHGANMTQAEFNRAVGWYNEWSEDQQAAREELDTAHKTELSDALIAKLGPAEYRANNNNVMSLLDAHFDKDTVQALLSARGPDGRALFNSTGFVEGMFGLARLVNPMATLVANGQGDGKSIDDELAALNTERSKDINAWMKNTKGRAREIELLELKARMPGKK